MRHKLNRALLRAATGTAGLVVMVPTAFSQDSGVSAENTVIVTANKREQDLRDVAGSVIDFIERTAKPGKQRDRGKG